MTGYELTLAFSALLFVAAFGQTVSHWTRHVDPARGVHLLLAMSGMLTAAMGAALLSVALPLIGRNDWLADYAGLPEHLFGPDTWVGQLIGATGTLCALAVAYRLVDSLIEQWRAGRVARNAKASLQADRGEVVILPVDPPDAMAIAGGPIVLTQGLVRTLAPPERRAVLAHERSHLSHRHHGYIRLAMLLKAANPLLHRVPDATLYLTERWADEDAAEATSRATVASALGLMASGTLGAVAEPGVLRAGVVAVEHRIHALLVDPPMATFRLVTPVLLTVASVVIASAMTEGVLDVVQIGAAVGAY